MQLATFIQNYVDAAARTERDFTGPRGWVHLTNLILKRYERIGWFRLDRKKEVGAEVNNQYWITIPSDLRLAEKIFAPPLYDYRQMEREYKFQIINGKIKLLTPFDKKTDPDTFTLSSWSTGGVSINDAAASLDKYKDRLLVVTNGTLIGKNITISGSAASSLGVAALSFYHQDGVALSTSTTGYITDEFLMLSYMAKYQTLTSQTDEIPIDDRLEHVLAQALIVERLSKKDSSFNNEYQILKTMESEVDNEEFSPVEGSRIAPRYLAGFDGGIPEDGFKYIGDGENE